MLVKLMRRLGWVRRAEHQRLLVQHVRLLDDHEKMIRLAQSLLRQTEAEQTTAKSDVAGGADKTETGAKDPKAAKLH